MSTNNQFDWVEFYKELAGKLLAYKGNRQELITKVKQIFSDTGINMPKLEKDNEIVDIDPFTKVTMEKKTVKDSWSMLMKFGSEKNLQKLRNGQLYMKNLQYYVDLEKATDDEAVGDKYDGQMVLENVKITMYDYETGAFVAQMDAPTASMNLGYLKCPVFCMFMFDYRNHTEEELIDDTLKVRYQFTEEQVEKMPGFGSHVLIVKNGNEFMERIKNGLLREGYSYTRDFVNYHDGNRIDHLREVAADDKRIAFWKRQKYSYQQEYRILVHTQVEDHLCVDIGDLSDITELIPTSVLLNTYMEAGFKVILEEK